MPDRARAKINGGMSTQKESAIQSVLLNRDRGESRDSSPPTPPYVRVRIRRFAGLSTDGFVLRPCQRLNRGFPRAGFGPSSSAVRASPFPAVLKASDLDFLPHGQFEISTSKHLSSVQAFSETRSAYYAVC